MAESNSAKSLFIGPWLRNLVRDLSPDFRGVGVAVKKKHFKPEQIAAKQVELGMPVAEVLRRTGISEQTFYR
jgi:hypothetical protein